MKRYEIFDPRDGRAIHTTRFVALAWASPSSRLRTTRGRIFDGIAFAIIPWCRFSGRNPNMEGNVMMKPGTRCECRDPKCPAKFPGDFYPHAHPDLMGKGDGQCTHADAKRMVTVCHLESVGHGRTLHEYVVSGEVPMCEACAQYHESKETR